MIHVSTNPTRRSLVGCVCECEGRREGVREDTHARGAQATHLSAFFLMYTSGSPETALKTRRMKEGLPSGT